ncbi:hypothetical protein VOLCADRAFT_89007 [Volvox carteri f. nagariensis]|uniref:Glycosyl transferase CAP10 domain-containing protein n=1 Tax=Volvox carteri f. nagariensis TaxID=3068 RepID=D8TQJ4_VOLCA|nr:uncharacterized protein VOLCADRAFT_89007 [Volvox carteri f. nagariensis]EFJ50044.1 hypothetical protein VOLCADRAFT_89007 [Volvox carteri f. nagariensis]|eukprot:XP_002948664.1 hypothetical protein VOLCADRAFT_89007 [Volvox carteri f. nagariensis]
MYRCTWQQATCPREGPGGRAYFPCSFGGADALRQPSGCRRCIPPADYHQDWPPEHEIPTLYKKSSTGQHRLAAPQLVVTHSTLHRFSLHKYLAGFVLCVSWGNGAVAAAQQIPDGEGTPQVTTEVQGLTRATTDDMMREIYKDNIDADFVPWRNRTYSVRLLHEMISKLRARPHPGPYLTVIVVKNGRVYDLPLEANYGKNRVAANRVRGLVECLNNESSSSSSPFWGVVPPDTVFLITMRDHPFCPRRGHSCKVPVFSIIKRWNATTNTSHELDVLLPQFIHVYDSMAFYPWKQKYDKALMRAAIKGRMSANSTREWLTELQRRGHPGAAQMLDTGITQNDQKKRFKTKLVPEISMHEHARWKYLLATDGTTASSRLGKLLVTNSVVLKEDSVWIEYYYRSLVPNVHYVPFNKDNVLQVLKQLRSDAPRCHRTAAAAQHFAFTFLSQRSKTLYVRQALRQYNSLIPDMSDFMEVLRIAPGALERPLTLDGLLEQMSAFVASRTGGG